MLDKQFDPIATQEAARRYWKPADFSPQGIGKPYCIMLPPPNVTGTLHMGHGFQHTLMDALIRYHRMCGDKTLWQPGTDHAGIATQIVVEKQLIQQGLDRKTLGRDAFEARVWEWKAQSGGKIVEQMKKLGTTADWSRECFTMDPALSKAVTHAFVALYNDGLIYRGRRLVNWDPVLQSALSDLEVLSEETQASLWHLRYPLVEGKEFLVVATTRPETLLGDVAVAVHPEDDRYKHLIGRQLRLPLTDRTIPVIADEYVDPGFGSGCVKITPAHDFNDFEVGKRHSLSSINIFTPEAKLNDEVPAAYRGLTREAARKKVLEDLTQANLIEKIDAHTLQVPKSERSGAVVEPYLTEQWYVKMEALGKAALEVVEKGEIEFIPEQWVNTYRQWLVNIQDWCVSRQLWWGHRIPAWYDDDGKIYVAETREAAQQQAGDKPLHQDDDVLDTWFSSALWPFSTLGWPEKTPEFETFYPTSVLVTGFDIIFFWVARMIMFGLYFTKKIPFKQVVFTGLIRDHDGQKMSKSKGNVIDPIDLITGIPLEALVEKRTSGMMLPSQAQAVEKATRKQFPEGIPAFGEDALRITFCALATQGRDVRFDLARMEGNRNFCNKIWNATRFIQMQLEKCEVAQIAQGFPEFSACDLPEQWLLEKLNQVIISARHYFETYRFDLLAQLLYEFTWYEFCDWYIEFAKIRLQQNPAQPLILQVLINALEVILRLLHPLMPFITEDIWQQALKPVLNLSGESLLLASYPETTDIPTSQASAWIEKLKSIILGVRQVRAFYRIEPKKILPLAYVQDPVDDLTSLVMHPSLKLLTEQLAKLETLKVATNDQVFEGEYGRSSVMESLVVIVPLTGLVDLEAEKAKAKKEKEKLTVELMTLKERLATPKAPEVVLDKWRARVTEIEAALEMMG